LDSAAADTIQCTSIRTGHKDRSNDCVRVPGIPLFGRVGGKLIREFIVHEYFGVDARIVWNAVKKDPLFLPFALLVAYTVTGIPVPEN